MWSQNQGQPPTSHHRQSTTMSDFSLPSAVNSPSNRQPLTSVLLESSPSAYEVATHAPFLIAAGKGRVSKSLLSRWLAQDRLYAQAYIGFIGALIARVDLPYVFVKDKSASLRWRIVHMLSSALSNIHHELDFFANVATRYGLDLDCPPRPDVYFTADVATKQYIDLFRAFWTDPSMSLMEGLVVLWATEQCYLTAWRFAAQGLSESDSRREDDQDGGALRQEFIPNWTSSAFEQFVKEIAEVTNLLADREDAWRNIQVYKAVWQHILDIEKRFWPEM